MLSPLVGEPPTSRDRRARLLLLLVWCGVVAWLVSDHVFWRDEVRALSLALSGSSFREMLANVQGEGHPALWYLLLRALHELFPYREVLPVAGAMLGFAAMATFAFRAPFRLLIVALVMLSAYGAFEYVVVARNYGISALVMFAIAALYPRIKNSAWLGLLLALLCNTNVPSCILAGFFLLFRFLELVADRASVDRRDWSLFAANMMIAAIGAWLCFIAVYPTANDAAVSSNLASLSLSTLANALVDTKLGFKVMGFWPPLMQLLLLASCLAFIHRPAALVASLGAFIAFKLFFYVIYQSGYRHEILYVIFLISLHWMVAEGAGGGWRERRDMKVARLIGLWAFVEILAIQSLMLFEHLRHQAIGIPESRVADVAAMLERPDLRGAIIMGDPDTMLESLPYYADNPTWLLREQRFGRVARLVSNSRSQLTLDHVLADAARLHQRTGRPIVYLSHLNLDRVKRGRARYMFHNVLIVTPDSVARFQGATRQIAKLRPAGTDEHYDVYVYPR